MARETWYDPSAFPELRDGPPWVMEEMIAAQPALVETIVRDADAGAAAALLRDAGTAVTTGCGTSEHAAIGLAEILTDAGLPARSMQALEAAIAPPRDGALLAVSHEGTTAVTVEALAAARAAAIPTAVVTTRPERAAAAQADAVVATPLADRSWCHTVGYTSPLAAGLALARALGAAVEPGAVGALVAAGLETRAAAAEAAGAIAACEHLIVIGSGVDRASARELTLKIEEAAWVPTAMRELETMLHGHLPACDERTGLVLVAAEPRGRDRRHERAEQLLAAAARVGIRSAALTARPFADDLTPAGQVPLPAADALPPAAGALIAAAVPLQLLTLELAHARGTSPDLIRRHEAPYREAAAASKEV